MTAAIINAAPMTIMQGVQDLSTRAPVQDAEVLPTHLPKIYLYTQKGPVGEAQMAVGDTLTNMFGAASFDERQPWATHATALINVINAQGNASMVERVKPDDAPDEATIRLSVDVLADQLTVYARNSDGSITVDIAGNPVAAVPAATVAGYKLKWVAELVPTVLGVSDFGTGAQKPGDQVGAGASTSTRYPVMDLKASSFGAWGNNQGIRLWAPTTASGQPLDDRLLATRKVYPFRIGCMARADGISTPQSVPTLFAEQYINACWKSGTIDPNTDAQVYLGDVFLDSWQDLSTPGQPKTFGPFGDLHIYDSEIATVLGLLYTAELAAAGTFTDLPLGGTAATDQYLINMISAVSSNNVPYYAVQLVNGGTGYVRPTENTVIYAQGGGDGTMTETAFAASVATLVAGYADLNSPLQDTAKFPESIIYDSGFPLATKKALAQFISLRKDTFVVLSTHDTSGPALTASQESSLAVALRTALQLYPESEYYGTSTMRGMVVGRSGKMIGSQYPNRLPLTLEIASNAAAYMGAGNGDWKPGFSFDRAPGSEVKMFQDINVTWTPAAVRNKDWANGLVWVENFSRRNTYFPALKTVYDNDTSILNSFFTALACVELEKVGDRARRQFSGADDLTNAQLIERVNQFIIDNTTGRFDGRYTIVPQTFFTSNDAQRGFSWSMIITLYGPNMKTVGTLTIQARRIEDLAK